MKLLSRFVWLIIAVVVLLLTLSHLTFRKADNEFVEIKGQFAKDLQTRLEKVTHPQEMFMSSFLVEACHWGEISDFVIADEPDTAFANFNFQYPDEYNIDAIWVFDKKGKPFYFGSDKDINGSIFQVEDIKALFKEQDFVSFYQETKYGFVQFVGSQITADYSSIDGYMFFVTKLDNRWFNEYKKRIDGDFFITGKNIVMDEPLVEFIHIKKKLSDAQGEVIAYLNVESEQRFLSLWDKMNLSNIRMLAISLLTILLLIVIMMAYWVIFPLRSVSESLSTNSEDPILKLKTCSSEMGEIARLISKYHEQTKELIASEDIKRQIMNHMKMGLIVADSETGEIFETNPHASQIIGENLDHLVGRSVDEFIKPTSNKEEFVLTPTSGKPINIYKTTSLTILYGRNVNVEVFIDISQSKAMQYDLISEKQKLNLAIKNSGLSPWEYDFKTSMMSLTNEWSFLDKRDKQGVYLNIHKSDLHIYNQSIDRLETGQTCEETIELRVQHPIKGSIWIRVTAVIVASDQDACDHIIGLIEEITQRVSVHQQLIKAKERAEESDKVKTSFLANLGHHIRTPMNSLIGLSQVIAEDNISTEDRSTFMNIIKNDTDTILNLIDQIISISSLDQKAFSFDKKKISLNGICKDIDGLYSKHKKTEQVSFSTATILSDGADDFYVDESKLKDVLHALIDFLFKFTDNGSIHFGYYINPADKQIIFYSKSLNCRLSEDVLKNIFKGVSEFGVPLENDQAVVSLSTTKALVNLMGGNLRVDASKEPELCFYVEIGQNS